MQTIETTCKQGTLVGNDLGGVLEFLGVPYAADGGRFKRVLPAASWEGTRDATKVAPVFPQRGKDYELPGENGPVTMHQEEDAFFVNVWTSSLEGAKPVIFWLHGGRWSMGSGSEPTYCGATFARNQDAVFVNVNYRLGPLANLNLPGISEENLAVDDILQALAWVHDNIAAFGGDPDNITLAGQSAGAWYVTVIAGMPEAAGLFSKVMLMSVPAPTLVSVEDSRKAAQLLLEKLKIEDDPQKIFDIDAVKIVKAADKVERDMGGSGLQFTPFDDGNISAETIFPKAIAQSGKLPLLDGVTAHEAAMFLAGAKPAIDSMDEAQLKGMMAQFAGGDVEAFNAAYDEKFPDDTAYERIVRVWTDGMFVRASDGITAAFENSYGYKIEFESANPVLRACHCADLPLLFGNVAVWKQDGFFLDNDVDEMAALSEKFQATVAAFMRTGDPSTGENPDWPKFTSSADRVVFR